MMKNFLLLCCLFIGAATAGNAQNRPIAGGPADKAKELQKQLRLTDKQTDKISAIYEESSRKFDKIKTTEHGDNAKMLVAIKPLRTETIQKIKAVLTREQGVKYDKLLKGAKNSGGSGWGDGWSSPPAE
jgi:Spy/CpxP family protein refolding chaperone